VLIAMAAVHSCSFASPAVFAISARARPSSTLASIVPAGRRDRSFPGLTLRQRPTAALRPGAVVRAQSRRSVPPEAGPADRYFVEERKRVMGHYNKIVGTDHGCLVRVTISFFFLCFFFPLSIPMPASPNATILI